MHILMVGAENDRLPNCKVGGVADVIRDIPYALNELGLNTSVIVPDYGQESLNREFVADIAVPFRQHLETASLWLVERHGGVSQYVVSHSLFSENGGKIYSDDGAHRPFATDATKFAFFSAVVCEIIEHHLIKGIDVIHLHDWHAAGVAVLAKFSPRFVHLKTLKLVYTVHNLALQGIRPFNHDDSSLEAWFPTLNYDGHLICDHRHPHCYNPMRSALVLCDVIHVVSPTYKLEVQEPSRPDEGFFGGEGLDHDMHQAAEQGRLFGILNGCDYSHNQKKSSSYEEYLNEAENCLFKWMSKSFQLETKHYIAHQRINSWRNSPPKPLITSIGRITSQKVLLLIQKSNNGIVLDDLAIKAAEYNSNIIILGSGDSYIESKFMQVMARRENVLFLNGYDTLLGDELYPLGDLFLMPSSFEPCGISQMLSMRAGQPCLVHGVGGLKDTVVHNESGFIFNGNSLPEQVNALLETFDDAINLLCNSPEQYKKISSNSYEQRFEWHQIAQQYLEKLYQV
ncbi:glycogen synthase [Pseudoalteromonas phenolica]|uniref:glycogen synthase n=1 Tax=Pseudoalteromonas phenolica TaxID=161398 RepID=UPI00110B922B|nr:glycogen/starch synthase [Pseudoalteromonas phenolica]TMN91453.1 glycogen synthase [Pseudoalteromonas phenolica]